MKTFALAGNPNCGKTTLFNSLTGSTAHVGNWPGVTVDKKEGVCKLGKEEVTIVDLPGIYSLAPYTPEEVITRNYISDTKPDCVINIVDSTNLERNLYLTTQLMEMDVPVVVALNMTDLLEKNGDFIDESSLERALGIPVIQISALKEKNLKKLIDVSILESHKKREGKTVLESSPVGHLIKDLAIAFHSLGVDNPTFHAVKLAELDELEVSNHPSLVHMVEHFREENVNDTFGGDYEALIADARYKYITNNYSIYLKRTKKIDGASKSDKIDKVLTHKFWGIPIFIAILFTIFHFVFSQNLFFFGNLFKEDCFSNIPAESIWNGFRGLFYSARGLNSPGVILSNLVDGLTSAFTNAVRVWLSNAPNWTSGLICDGVLGGLFSVIGFLPQILLLFLFFSILEDSGYMARIAFILDRFFRRFGLSGRAFLPMIMGFGCSVPAMINTRTIADDKERIATIRVIPFFSCGAKLPILTAISGCIAQAFNFASVDLITLFMYLLGMTTAIVAIFIMRKTTLRGKSSPFVMELPTYHMPQAKSTFLLVWDKAKHFFKKAFTIILASTIVIWFISHFSFTWNYLGDNAMEQSILANLGQLIKPLFIPVGFGIPSFGWVFVVAIIAGLIAKENVIATLGTLAASILVAQSITIESNNYIYEFIKALNDESSPIYNAFFASHGTAILLSFIAFNMLTIPCSATLATARAELGKKKFGLTILFWVVTSFIISGSIFAIASWWWTSFIVLLVLVIIILSVICYDKRKLRKEI